MDSGIEANQASLMRSSLDAQRPEEKEGRNAERSAPLPGQPALPSEAFGRNKHGSLGYQMENALKKIFHPGHRRHHDKRLHRKDVIRGITTMRGIVGDAYQFAHYVRVGWPEVHDLEQVVPAMAQSFLDDLAARGRSEGRVKCAAGRLRKLDAACRKTGVFSEEAPALLPYRPRGTKRSTLRVPRRGAYTEEEAQRIIESVSARCGEAGRVLELMWAAGLRVSEAVYLRGLDIDPRNLTITLQGAVNHAKGGRPRVIRLTPEYQDLLERMRRLGLEGPDGHLFSLRRRLRERMRARVKWACRLLGIEPRGSHGFRKTFANREFQRERSTGIPMRAAMRKVSQQLGHNRVSVVRLHYLDPKLVQPARRGAGESARPDELVDPARPSEAAFGSGERSGAEGRSNG